MPDEIVVKLQEELDEHRKINPKFAEAARENMDIDMPTVDEFQFPKEIDSGPWPPTWLDPPTWPVAGASGNLPFQTNQQYTPDIASVNTQVPQQDHMAENFGPDSSMFSTISSEYFPAPQAPLQPPPETGFPPSASAYWNRGSRAGGPQDPVPQPNQPPQVSQWGPVLSHAPSQHLPGRQVSLTPLHLLISSGRLRRSLSIPCLNIKTPPNTTIGHQCKSLSRWHVKFSCRNLHLIYCSSRPISIWRFSGSCSLAVTSRSTVCIISLLFYLASLHICWCKLLLLSVSIETPCLLFCFASVGFVGIMGYVIAHGWAWEFWDRLDLGLPRETSVPLSEKLHCLYSLVLWVFRGMD
jgi:hypothetical protein